MIDLHSHTNESDGSLSPTELVREARRAGVRILAITDHDTFAGYDQARPLAADAGPKLVCGIELSTKLRGHPAHVLGYFIAPDDLAEFRAWVLELQISRHERNLRLAARLRELGLDITLEDAAALGRGMTGRPHFAQVMVKKGYVQTVQQAFTDYLSESGQGYVSRHEPEFAEAVAKIRAAGGIASLAHPVRLKEDVATLLPAARDAGLNAIEAYHSDHSPEQTELYLALAKQHGLLVTGGSDFHGPAVKPGIELGTGRAQNLKVPDSVMEPLNRAAPRSNGHLPTM
jgi:3',5'-nucleoside bisphosphate phosphatase